MSDYDIWQTPRGSTIKFRKDFLGDVEIQTNAGTITVPAQDILDLVAWFYIARQKIARLEQASTDELLLGPEYMNTERYTTK